MHTTDELELSAEPQLAVKVPWRRAGYPHDYSGPETRHKWNGFVANTGSMPERLFDDERLADTGARTGGGRIPLGYLEERSLLEWWDYENNGNSDGRANSLLYTLLRPIAQELIKSDRDMVVAERTAASVIMWLGSNVGRSFLRTAFEHAESEQERLQPKVDQQRKFLQSVGELSADWPDGRTHSLKRKPRKGKKA